MNITRVPVIDSHTGGEPTRVVLDGFPDLGSGSVLEKAKRFQSDHDQFRKAVILEPRGNDVLVGALLLPPSDPNRFDAGVIFFNNVGILGMCGHGTIGLVATLAYLGKIQPGPVRLETVVGPVTAEWIEGGQVAVRNVSSYRYRKDVPVLTKDHGQVIGDIAWGGNWFFLAKAEGRELNVGNVEALTDLTWDIRQSLIREGIKGKDGGEIDHVELFGPALNAENHGRNFVLCPGKAYDRSPCGTGTSAKLACLLDEGTIQPGDVWKQESVTGSVFEACGQPDPELPGQFLPTVTGSAFLTAESTLILDQRDPFLWGINQ